MRKYAFGHYGGFVLWDSSQKGDRCIRYWSTETCRRVFRSVMKDEKVQWPVEGMSAEDFNEMHVMYNRAVRDGKAPFEIDV